MVSNSTVERVCRFAASLLPSGSRLLVAVSGGSDSVALCRILHELQEQLGIVRLAIVHVNHGLRGSGSDEDEACVRQLASELELPCHVVRLSGKSGAGAGIEAWARGRRYRAFAELRAGEHYDLVATGHTIDDQVETLVMRLLRGSGLRGLAGIWMRRDDGVVRPLLNARRAELVDYLTTHRYDYRIDPSNADTRFLRNRIRHRFLPSLDTAFPRLVPWAGSAALALQYLLDSLRPVENNWIHSFVVEIESGFAIAKKAPLDSVLGREVLSECLRKRAIPFTKGHIERIVALGARADGVVLLPKGWRAEAFRERIVITSEVRRDEPFSFQLVVPGVTQCDGHATFSARIDSVRRPRQDAHSVASLDLQRCRLPVRFRSIDDSDRFHPLGAAGRRRLGAWLKKQGLGRDRRQQLGVVVDAEGQILWVPGIRIAHPCRITSQTRRVLHLCYESLRI